MESPGAGCGPGEGRVRVTTPRFIISAWMRWATCLSPAKFFFVARSSTSSTAASSPLPPRMSPRAHLRRVLPEPLALHDLDVAHADGATRRMARVGVSVHPAVGRVDRVHRVLDGLSDHDAAERQVARGHTLGERHDVGLDVPVREREPAARAAEPRDDLVAD